MLTWKRFMMSILSFSILLTQGVQLPYLAYAMEETSHAPINGEVTFSWTTSDQVPVGATFNPYEGLQAIDADGDNVAVLVRVEGEVDTSREGVYAISYSIKNVDGQTFTTVRQVEVVSASSSHEMEEQLPNNEMNQNTLTSLNDVEWILYDRESQQELIKLKLDVEKGQYLVQVIEDLQPLLLNEDEKTLNQEILKLRILLSKHVEQVSDQIKEITYQVTNSWGCTTEVVRYITEEIIPEPFINLLSGEETTSTSIENNIVTVKGIDYTRIGNNIITVKGIDCTGIGDQRFKITFDARTKKIFVTEADNRTMNSRVEGEDFKLVLYNSKGEVKKSIILTGRDRANSSTLNELINQGWHYALGDMISLWHYEPEQKISVAEVRR